MESIACYIQRGKSPKYAESGRARVVSQKCIQWSGFDLTVARRISDESLGKYGEERFLREKDILWNSTGTGTVGRVGLYSGDQEPVVADSHVTVIRLTNFIPEYIWCYLASPIIQAKMVPNRTGSMVSGTTNQVELSTTKVADLPVPCPPIEEQKLIVAKVVELMAFIDRLEKLQSKKLEIAKSFSQAAVTTLTGTQIKDQEKMKAPKTELVTELMVKNKPKASDDAPLAKLIAKHKGSLSAKVLWQQSGLSIDAFYQRLKAEMANSWIVEPDKAVMKEVEDN
jgi:restriction endonuclease S subunit